MQNIKVTAAGCYVEIFDCELLMWPFTENYLPSI